MAGTKIKILVLKKHSNILTNKKNKRNKNKASESGCLIHL